MRSLFFALTIIFILQGCAQPPQQEVPPAQPIAKPEPVVVPVKKAPPMQVVILVSEDSPAYMEVATELAKMLGSRSSIQLLASSQVKNLKIINSIKNTENNQVVAIGLNASIISKSLTGKHVIFCQVFNYHDYSLISVRHKGVSMLPSLSQIFRTWRNLSPVITDIGVITGPGFDEEIEAAKIAAKPYLITLHHETVKSDKEFQYAYKKLGKQVQGYWLLPDNRVLSGNTLRDVITYSVQNSKMVAVFNNELLKLGGLFSVSSNAHDIALQVAERLEDAQGKDIVPGPDIVYPERVKLKINSVMAGNLGIEIPPAYKKFTDAP